MVFRPTLVRALLVIALGACWWYAMTGPDAWARSLLSSGAQWSWKVTWWVGGIGEALLAAGSIFMLMPIGSRHSRADDAMGIGCARAGGAAMAGIALVLALAIVLKIRWLIHLIGLGTIFIAIVLALSLITEAIKAFRKRAK